MARPPDIAYALDDEPSFAEITPLALQSLVVQSIYFLLPGIIASAAHADGIFTTNFLCLTIAGLGWAALLQVATRGPIGSGYPLAFVPSPVFLAAYLLAVQDGNLGAAGAMTVIAGIFGLLLATLLRRLNTLVPTEMAGVVVFLIGASLLPRVLAQALPTDLPAEERYETAILAVVSLTVMMGIALTRSRLTRFGVLIGGAFGTVVSLLLGFVPSAAGDLLAHAPWIAIPTPILPRFDLVDGGLLPAFLLTLVASTASWLGDLVAFQRAADGSWARPDEPPIRRGVLANSVALFVAGLAGGMAPSSSSACVGLAIATGTLARRIAIVGSVMLLLLACLPKVVALFVLVPDPVKAAMLADVCCFMMAAGCQLITTRMLDAQRTFTVGIGLSTGLAVLTGRAELVALLPPALASPVTAGALVAFVLNLLTKPLIARSTTFGIAIGPGLQQAIEDRCIEMGGAWGARRGTIEQISHCLLELVEVLAGRGNDGLSVEARFTEGQISLVLNWAGDPLPPPAARPDVSDLEGPLAAQEAFAVWLATRHAQRFEQRETETGTEARLDFAD
ncbi:MAG: solute carrier family 23 protein [Geminicoccaceae bacterium]